MPLIMNNGFDMRGATMAQLSTALSGWADRKVIDKTGIAGMFDIRLDWSGTTCLLALRCRHRLRSRAFLRHHGQTRRKSPLTFRARYRSSG